MNDDAIKSPWIAEEVKNWTQALANLTASNWDPKLLEPIETAILAKLRSLLGIADDK